MVAAMSRQAEAETVMIMTMMYEELFSFDVNSVGGTSPVTQANTPSPIYVIHAMSRSTLLVTRSTSKSSAIANAVTPLISFNSQ